MKMQASMDNLSLLSANNRKWHYHISVIYRKKNKVPCLHTDLKYYCMGVWYTKIDTLWQHERMYPTSLMKFAKGIEYAVKMVKTT